MRRLRSFLLRLGGVFRRGRGDAEFASEIDAHLQMHIEDNLRRGMNPQEARREALMKLGGVAQTEESYREQRGVPVVETLLQDLRFAARMLRKNPGTTAIMVFTLSVAIGATTAIFSVVYGVLLRPLPYTEPNRIMAVFEVNSKGTWSRLADPNFDDFRDQNHSFQALAKYNANIASVSGASQPTRTMVAGVTPDFFKVFRVQPLSGRAVSAEDNKKGAAPVVLVSYGYWKQYLGSSPDLSEPHLKIDNVAFSVIGVLPDRFQFPPDVHLWLPADREGELTSRTSHNYTALALLPSR